MTAENVAVEAQPQLKEEEKKNDKNMFERVRIRFSSRSKKQKVAKTEDKDDNMHDVDLSEKEETSDKSGKKAVGIEKVKEILKNSKQQKEEKKKDEPTDGKSTQSQNENEKKASIGLQKKEECNNKIEDEELRNDECSTDDTKKISTLKRVKERLSMRKNKKSTEKSDDAASDKKSSKDEKLTENEVNEPKEKIKEENVKTETFIQRIMKLFRSKKKQKSSETSSESKRENAEECDISDEDKEILAITGDKDENDSSTIPQITTTKPPLPGMISLNICIYLRNFNFLDHQRNNYLNCSNALVVFCFII